MPRSISDWCLRIDADEFLSDALRRDIRDQLLDRRPPTSITGFYVNRAIYFSGRRIRWGGCYPVRMLRLFSSEHRADARSGGWTNISPFGTVHCEPSGDLVDDNAEQHRLVDRKAQCICDTRSHRLVGRFPGNEAKHASQFALQRRKKEVS